MKLNYTQVFEEAWNSMRDDLALVAGLTAVYLFGLWVSGRLPFFGAVIAGPLTAGYVLCLLRVRRGERFNYEDFLWGFYDFNRFLHLVLLAILIGFGTGIGFLLLVIPGIWFLVSTIFAMTLFVLYKQDAVSSIMKSIEIVQQRWLNVFGFTICLAVLWAAGAVCFGIGLLVAVPVSTLALMIAAEQLMETPMYKPLDPGPTSHKNF